MSKNQMHCLFANRKLIHQSYYLSLTESESTLWCEKAEFFCYSDFISLPPLVLSLQFNNYLVFSFIVNMQQMQLSTPLRKLEEERDAAGEQRPLLVGGQHEI